MWVQTGPPGAHTLDTEVDSNDWDTEDEYSEWDTDHSGSENSDTEQSGPIDLYIGDKHDDHYDEHPRWCDIKASDCDDEYADMGSLVDSSDDDRPSERLSEETDDEEEVAIITTDLITAAPGVPPPWSLVGRIDPKPVKMTRQGIGSIFDLLQTVHMVPSARKAVTGDGVCIGLTFKTCPFMHPKTQTEP